MASTRRAAVTGAFSYTGSYIARRLLNGGGAVITLTGHPDRESPLAGRIPAFPFDFDRPDRMAAHLAGVDVLYNTYWVRFEHGESTFARAVANTVTLLNAAREAGVRRVVHISIAHADPESSLPYFRGKGVAEGAVRESGLSYAILRPTLIFGKEDVLLNNIAWLLRRFPIFGVPGSGNYRVQPIYVDDLAAQAVELGAMKTDVVRDAVGPETFTFRELVGLLDDAVGGRTSLVSLPPGLALALAGLLGAVLGDVLLTADEMAGLRQGLLVKEEPPAGTTRLTEWVRENAPALGATYASELRRHFSSIPSDAPRSR